MVRVKGVAGKTLVSEACGRYYYMHHYDIPPEMGLCFRGSVWKQIISRTFEKVLLKLELDIIQSLILDRLFPSKQF
jgi:hypothetical protein